MQQPTPAPTAAPAAAQTVTFVTPDGMLVTQTITPLQQPQAETPTPVANIQQARGPLQVNVHSRISLP